jgi:succinate-semialdehyde dehydrogenase/glutarate-semialdehyde dehydrogenase
MLINSSLLKEHGYINGKWVGSDAKSRLDIKNAYTNEVISTFGCVVVDHFCM